MVNMTRTKAMQGRKQLEVYQEFYTEERIVRIKGEGDTPIEKVINQRAADTIVNDITVGTYDVSVNTVPWPSRSWPRSSRRSCGCGPRPRSRSRTAS